MNHIKKIILSMALFSTLLVADTFKTNKGQLTILPIHHASTYLSWNNKNILLDPAGGVERYKNFKNIDLILLSDIHGDHLNAKVLNHVVNDSTRIIAPQAVIAKLPTKLQKMASRIDNMDVLKTMGLTIEAVAMYNLPESTKAKHTKGRGNGYVISFANKRVYFSGDSADIKEMRELKDIDIAFVCMNLPYTMSLASAASAVLDFKPKIVYPYHYRGKKDGNSFIFDTKKFKETVNFNNKDIKVELRDWYK